MPTIRFTDMDAHQRAFAFETLVLGRLCHVLLLGPGSYFVRDPQAGKYGDQSAEHAR